MCGPRGAWSGQQPVCAAPGRRHVPGAEAGHVRPRDAGHGAAGGHAGVARVHRAAAARPRPARPVSAPEVRGPGRGAGAGLECRGQPPGGVPARVQAGGGRDAHLPRPRPLVRPAPRLCPRHLPAPRAPAARQGAGLGAATRASSDTCFSASDKPGWILIVWVVSGEDGGGGHWPAHHREHPAARPRAAAEHHGGRQLSSGWPRAGHVTSDLTADWSIRWRECVRSVEAELEQSSRHDRWLTNSAVKRSIGSTIGAFSWLKVPNSAFTFKTLLRHYAKQTLTPQ